jgi:hypothetical protein
LLDITRDECCELFEEYFKKKLNDPEFRAKVMELRGKKLGCWCKCQPECNHPKCKNLRCHVETIVEWLNNNK